MGKNTTKKGKQKEPTPAAVAAPTTAPPIVPSPPSAHHIQPPPGIIGTIVEEEEFGGLPGGLVDGEEEETWQDAGHSADGWGADAPGNSNDDLDNNDGWGTNDAPSPPMPPPKQSGEKSHARPQHRSTQPQTQPSSLQKHGRTPAGAKHRTVTSSWGDVKSQQTQDAWGPANDGWEEQDDGLGVQEDWRDADNEWGGGEDGWNTANNGWVQQPHSVTWGHATSAHTAQSQAPSQAPSQTPTTGWQSWGEEARRLPKDQQPYPMTPTAAGISSAPIPASNWQYQTPQHGKYQYQQPQHAYNQHHVYDGKKNKRSKSHQHDQQQQQVRNNINSQEEGRDVWGLGDGWSDLDDDEDQDDTVQDPWGHRVRFPSEPLRASLLPSSAPSIAPSAVVENFTVNTLPQNKLGLSNIPMSKTLSYAYSGSTPSSGSEPGRAAMQQVSDFPFVESRGEALKSVQRAFYGKQRKASDRFHWLFPSEKDERVSSLLGWIHAMSFGIASFGLQKFLQTRERGALIINADFRPVHSPNEPAFDWLSWNQIQPTLDRTLQESVGYYNPAMHIIVFVFLPSPSGNSVAIWRRKLAIPSNIRLAYQAQITQAIASLQKEYPVHVDELPVPTPELPPPPPPKKKRKWYKLWLST